MGVVRRWGAKGEGQGERKYFSAEFQMENPWVFYKFRLRQSEVEPMFVLVKKDSQALECLAPGQTLFMTFHFEDNDIPPERREVRVKSVQDALSAGMAGHVMVAFSV